jgi:general secretion pathway protein G
MKNSIAGFTLVELLIVLAIIGILTGFLLSNFSNTRQRARDTQRKSDLYKIQSAVERYFADNGSYPQNVPNCPPALMDINCGSDAATAVNYLSAVPRDPLSIGSGPDNTIFNGGFYDYVQCGSKFMLYACLENANDPQAVSAPPCIPPLYNSSCPSNKYYELQSQ